MSRSFSNSKLEIRFFQTSTRTEPVRKWLKKLTNQEKKIIGVDLKTIEFS